MGRPLKTKLIVTFKKPVKATLTFFGVMHYHAGIAMRSKFEVNYGKKSDAHGQ